MADKPLILALANPTPEILPELALEVRPDAVLCTGRTDYPNQVNNVLVFPFLFRGALDAGATTVNIPDTVGYLMPGQYAAMIADLIANVPNIGRAVVSTHCHDDLGLAVANSLAGVQAGARQVECTINGIGERAGNAALEEVVMALRTRHDDFGVETTIKTERLYPVSRMLSSITGLAVQRNKAIVGRNAFAHESGIHQDGMLKNRSTYEIMRPEDVGVPQTDLVLGKHSGRHALRDRVVEMGYTLSDEQVEIVFNDFKALADKKKEIYDEDLAVLIEKHLGDAVPASWQLLSLHTTAGTSVLPTATVSIKRPDGEVVQDAAIGDGPVDAIFKAVERVTGVHANLHEFVVRSVSQGKDAQGEVTLELEVESGEASFRGRAASTDIIEASALAYLNAVNAISARKDRTDVREVVGRPGAGL
ncbi:hypothetical protein HK102_010651, partial [Quaeritorhiza haematococci]